VPDRWDSGSYAGDLERRCLVRPGVDRGEAVHRDRGEEHQVQPGAPRGRRAYQISADLLDLRGRGLLRRDREGLRRRRRRDGDPGRRRLRRPAPVHVTGDRRAGIRPGRAGRPDPLREGVLPGTRGHRGEAVRAAPRRPDRLGEGRPAPRGGAQRKDSGGDGLAWLTHDAARAGHLPARGRAVRARLSSECASGRR